MSFSLKILIQFTIISNIYTLVKVYMFVCFCREVSKEEILESFQKGNQTIDLIQKDTQACTVCECCSFEIEELIKESNNNEFGS